VPDNTTTPASEVQVPDEAVELLAEANAISELWDWWEDNPTREAKEGRQRKRYAQLTERIKDSWREGARAQIALVRPAIQAQVEEQVRERLLSDKAISAARAGVHWREEDGEIESVDLPHVIRAAIDAALNPHGDEEGK
jgi:hypothetical protein